jgi:histone H3/H4
MKTSNSWIRDKQIKRFCTRVDIPRVSGSVYEPVRSTIISYIDDLLKSVLLFTRNDKRKTVYIKDLTAALEVRGSTMIGDVKTVDAVSKLKDSKFILQKKGFETYVRSKTDEMMASQNLKMHFGAKFFDLFHYVVEQFTLNLLNKSYDICKHANRKGLAGKDVEYVIEHKIAV